MNRWIRIVLAVAAYVLYGGAVLVLERAEPSAWTIEAESGLPAAVSYAVYGAKFGSIERNVLTVFHAAPVREAIKQTSTGILAPGPLIETVVDGNGVGWSVFAGIAMQLFGPDLLAVTLFFLLLMGVSTAIFLFRFQDDRMLMVPLLYCAFTLLIATPLVTSHLIADQLPIGGIRFFSLVAVLPALHVMFEILDTSKTRGWRAGLGLVMLGLQMALLALVILGRLNAGYLVGAILGAIAWRSWTARRTPVMLRAVLLKSGVATLAGIAMISAVVASNPAYLRTGQTFGTFWHRILTGIIVDPAWPYGNLAEVYDCKEAIPGGLSHVNSTDRQAHCIWWAWEGNRGRSAVP